MSLRLMAGHQTLTLTVQVRILQGQPLIYALNSVVQSTRLIRGRSAVRICECVPIRSPRLKGRTPDSHSGNAGFKSRGDHQCYVGRSLMVKHRIVAPVNAGSSPVDPPSYEHVSQWSKEAGCNPVVRRFESSRALQYGKVAPMVERRIEVPGGAGSSPAFTTNIVK